jgi:hypothetical protein
MSLKFRILLSLIEIQSNSEGFDNSSHEKQHENTNDTDKRTNNESNNNFDQTTNPISHENNLEKCDPIKLTSFSVRCESVPTSRRIKNNNDSLISLVCQWAMPSSSSTIDYYTIERQVGDNNEWLPIGEKINQRQNQIQMDLSLNEKNAHLPSYFRLKAHLHNGQTCESESTDGIFFPLSNELNAIIPDVEILSSNSVELTWPDINQESKTTNEQSKSNIYAVEKKEHQAQEITDWETVGQVPLSQRTVRIASLTDASQCEFRLIPSDLTPTTNIGIDPSIEMIFTYALNNSLQ